MTFELLEAILKNSVNTSKQHTAYLLQTCSKPNRWLILETGNNVKEVRGCHVIC